MKHLKEERIWGINNRISGKYDGLLIDAPRALVYDFKTGRGKVEKAEGNLQLRALAVLVKEKYPEILELTAAIIQPLAEGENKVDCVVYESEELLWARAELESALDKADAENAPRIPGAEQCQYCLAKGDCPEAQAEAMSLVTVEADGMIMAKMPELLDRCILAENIVKAIREKAKEELGKNPESIPGWKLKEGHSREFVNDVNGVWAEMESRGTSVEEFTDACSITKSKLKPLLKEKTGLKGQSLESELEAVLDGNTKSKTTAPSLAKE